MATVSIANTTANISGKTVILAERDFTITGSWTFSRSPSAPFAVASGSAAVSNLDADKLDGLHASSFATLTGGLLPVASGGTNSGTALNNNRAIVSAAGALVEAAAATNGQLLIGSTGAAPVVASVTAGAGVSVTGGAGTLTLAASNVVLIRGNTGTDTSAGATTVDSVALSGLTVKDVLDIDIDCTAVTQACAGLQLYSVTDGTSIGTFTSGALTAGETVVYRITLQVGQGSNTIYHVFTNGRGTTLGAQGTLIVTTGITSWLTGITLGLRHTGVTAGGTLQWKWLVTKRAGQ